MPVVGWLVLITLATTISPLVQGGHEGEEEEWMEEGEVEHEREDEREDRFRLYLAALLAEQGTPTG